MKVGEQRGRFVDWGIADGAKRCVSPLTSHWLPSHPATDFLHFLICPTACQLSLWWCINECAQSYLLEWQSNQCPPFARSHPDRQTVRDTITLSLYLRLFDRRVLSDCVWRQNGAAAGHNCSPHSEWCRWRAPGRVCARLATQGDSLVYRLSMCDDANNAIMISIYNETPGKNGKGEWEQQWE